MRTTIPATRASVVKYQIVTVVLVVALAVAIAWAAMAAGSTKTVVRVSEPAASTSGSLATSAGGGDFCRPYHGHC